MGEFFLTVLKRVFFDRLHKNLQEPGGETGKTYGSFLVSGGGVAPWPY
jgi:hypothetical protein